MLRWICILLIAALAGCGKDRATPSTAPASAPASQAKDRATPSTAPASAPASQASALTPFKIAAPDAVLLVTGGTHGRLELCDCPDTLPGGLSRRAGLIAAYRKAYPAAMLLDTGDVLSYEPQAAANRYVLVGYRMLGYDVVVLGDHEWSALGAGLAGLLRASPMTYLSTSATADSAELPVVREIVHQTPAGKLAILSHLGPDTLLFAPHKATEKLKLDAIEATLARAARLKATGCAVILIAHVTEVELDELKISDAVDLVIQANVTHSQPRPRAMAGRPILKVGGTDHVGVVALKLREGRIAEMDFRLEVVTEDWPADERLLKLFQAYVREVDTQPASK